MSARTYGEAVAGPRGRCVRIHDKYSRQGKYRIRKRCFENKTFDWQHSTDGQTWIDKLPRGIEPGLYFGDKIAAADSTSMLWICEGEKDAERLHDLGELSTSTPHGALVRGKSWEAPWTRELRKFVHVTILEDNDEAGRIHVPKVATALRELIPHVKAIRFQELPEHGDLSDWLDGGHRMEELISRVEAAPEWAPPEWPELKPLTKTDLPEFPVLSLPEPLRDFVREESRAIQTPPALAGLVAICTCAAAVAKKYEVQVRPGWSPLPLNLYAVIVLPSGDRKSTVFAHMTEPLRAYERLLVENSLASIADERTRIGILHARHEHLKKATAKSSDAIDRKRLADEAREVARELAAVEPPADPLVILDDATPQSIEIAIAEQGGKIAVLSDEATPFDAAANFVGKNAKPHISVFLKAHCGGDIRVNRQGRPPVFVRRAALTLCVTIQPDALEEVRDTFTRRGLLNRVLFAVPRSLIGHRQTDPPPDPVPRDVARRYTDAVTRLLELEGVERTLTLSSEAHALFVKAETQTERDLRDDGRLRQLKGLGEKLKAELAKIAAIFHLIIHRDDPRPWETPIDRDTMWRAITFLDFFVAHGTAAFDDLGLLPRTEKARHILEWVRRGKLVEFSQSQLHHDNAHFVGRPEEWYAPLNLLCDSGRLRPKEPAPPKSKGGRPRSAVYEVNPAVHAEGAEL